MKKIFVCFCFILAAFTAQAKKPQAPDSLRQLRKEREFLIENRSLKLFDVATVQTEDWTELFRIPEHPAFDRLLTLEKEHEILAEINQRRREHGSDTLLTADYFYVWRPYFDWLENEDPHYRIYTMPYMSREHYKSSKKVLKDPGFRRLPFDCVLISDTLVVSRSFDPLYEVGDMIVSINGVSVPEYMKYSYADRHVFPSTMMLYYYYSFAVDSFDIKLVRKGEEIEFNTPGTAEKSMDNHMRPDTYNITTYKDAGAGYIQLRRFYPHNGRLIKTLHKAILDFKRQGITNVIIDVRRNGGGNGHNFDKLISIFIDKPTVAYLAGQKLMVSEKTLEYYDFLTGDMIGTVVDIPKEDFVKEFPTDPKMYVDGMNYYVLISKDTGSIAASFVNILQYNGAATIVGEPLRHNALKYGEAVAGNDLPLTMLVPVAVSTMEFDEYTKAVDGVLVPDIPIPYIASQYMTGKDAVLEKLLEIIKNDQ